MVDLRALGFHDVKAVIQQAVEFRFSVFAAPDGDDNLLIQNTTASALADRVFV